MPGSICSVVTCRKSSNKNDNAIFHRFPKNPTIIKKWIFNCNLDENCKTNSRRVCSRHFCPEDYKVLQTGYLGRRILKPDAVPSLHMPQVPHVPREEVDPLAGVIDTEMIKIEPYYENENAFTTSVISTQHSSSGSLSPISIEQSYDNFVWIKEESVVATPSNSDINLLKQCFDLKQENSKLRKRVAELEKHSIQLNRKLKQLSGGGSITSRKKSKRS